MGVSLIVSKVNRLWKGAKQHSSRLPCLVGILTKGTTSASKIMVEDEIADDGSLISLLQANVKIVAPVITVLLLASIYVCCRWWRRRRQNRYMKVIQELDEDEMNFKRSILTSNNASLFLLSKLHSLDRSVLTPLFHP